MYTWIIKGEFEDIQEVRSWKPLEDLLAYMPFYFKQEISLIGELWGVGGRKHKREGKETVQVMQVTMLESSHS